MRILNCGDLHITNHKPKNRTDDYFRTVLDKFKQECQIAVEEKCDIVILPGDVFDSYKENHLVVQCIINIMKRYSLKFLCVAGQHDQQFHNPDLTGTALGTLLTHTDLITLIKKSPYHSNTFGGHLVSFYGASWNEEIPEIIDPNGTNILVLHKMIVDEKLWAEQEGHTWANHMLLKTKFDLIVSGDNHNQFVAQHKGRFLVNMGSMMRSTIAQINHKPAVTVYDTETKTLDIIDLDVKPFEEVMQIEKATKEKERNAQLEAFVHSLKEKHPEMDSKPSRNFTASLEKYVEDNEIDPEIADIIFDCLEDE